MRPAQGIQLHGFHYSMLGIEGYEAEEYGDNKKWYLFFQQRPYLRP